jgi:hypothetical protein
MDVKISAKELRSVAVHEAAHAVMAVLRDMTCWGIFLHADTHQFGCHLISGVPLGKSDYLQSAAGAAGELVFFGGYSNLYTQTDRLIFSEPGAPAWEVTVEEARTILMAEREKIRTVASLVEETVKLPCSSVKTRRKDGDASLFYELVNAGQLYQVIGHAVPTEVDAWIRSSR